MQPRSSYIVLYDDESKDDNFKCQLEVKQADVKFRDAAAAPREIEFDFAAYKFKRAAGDFDLDSRFMNAEGRLDTIEGDPAAGNNAAAIAQEVVDRQAGDVALGNQVTAEVNRAVSAEQAIQQDVDDNEAAAAAARTALDAKVDQEISDRAAAVSAEASTRQGQIDALQLQLTNLLASSPAELDTLAEIVAAFQSADNTMAGTIASLQQQSDENKARLDALLLNN